MKRLLSKGDLSRMSAVAAAQIRSQSELLSKLDSVGGDGDHGAAMTRAMAALESAFHLQSTKSTSEMMKEAGWAVMNIDGGASSAMLGTFFVGMSSVKMADEFRAEDLAESFEAGLCAVMRQTQARVGDKTMMDALIPAVGSFREAVQTGKSAADAMALAAASANAGARSTRTMACRYGRARSLGERTVGHPDPGAVSMALLFAGFRDALTTIKEEESHV